MAWKGAPFETVVKNAVVEGLEGRFVRNRRRIKPLEGLERRSVRNRGRAFRSKMLSKISLWRAWNGVSFETVVKHEAWEGLEGRSVRNWGRALRSKLS